MGEYSSESEEDSTKIVGRRKQSTVENDRRQMLRLQANAAYSRIRDARRLVDDLCYEYFCDVVYECQRGFNFLGKANFSTKLLHPMDPAPWSDATMQLTVANVHSFQLPDPSWEWVSPRWLIDMTLDVDEDGWQYSSRFASSDWHAQHSASRSFVRRRRWLRLRRRAFADAADSDSSAEEEDEQQEYINHACVEEDPASAKRRSRTAGPKEMAAKIRNKVSRGYVGACPKLPNKPVSRQLAYTLKDGKYKSHLLRRTRTASYPINGSSTGSTRDSCSIDHDSAIQSSSCRRAKSISIAQLKSANRDVGPRVDTGFRKRKDSGNGTRADSDEEPELTEEPVVVQLQRSLETIRVETHQQSPALRPLRIGMQGSRQSVSANRHARDRLLALPTGGVRRLRPSLLSSSAASSDDLLHCGSGGADVPCVFPRLVARMAPEPTAPLDADTCSATRTAALGTCGVPDDHDGRMAEAIVERRRHTNPLRPVASAVWGALGSLRTTSAALAQSAPTSPAEAPLHVGTLSASTTAVNLLPYKATTAGLCGGMVSEGSLRRISSSTSVVSHSNTAQPDRLSRASTGVSQASSSMASLDFLPNDLPLLEPYADPYAAFTLPAPAGFSAVSDGTVLKAPPPTILADARLVRLASASLRRMLDDVLLDRERLEFLRGCLRLGGLSAATVWYCLPWLHFELLQFDSARQRLIALLLANAHTCPPDALRYYAAAAEGFSSDFAVTPEVLLQESSHSTAVVLRECDAVARMSAGDREEYVELVGMLDNTSVRALGPSQVWRLFIRPLVDRDADLFYSDLKLMAVGVARWHLTQESH
ncbi:hypothetical protein H4S08_003986 [Coemansia sp. RSA 1365]|nr:hypothetical protein H4S08_003986 [Coemansia sp. RSA 1365]